MSEDFSTFGKVRTSYGDDFISQETSVSVAGVAQKLSSEIMNLKDQGAKEALVNMGWVPPEEFKHELKEVAIKAIESIRHIISDSMPFNTEEHSTYAIAHRERMIDQHIKMSAYRVVESYLSEKGKEL